MSRLDSLYGEQHRAMQRQADSERLADRLNEAIVAAHISEEHGRFIEAQDMFFLSTVDHRGFPTCSYKGGPPGLVRVLDDRTLAFPSYDGNGMYLSMGNISAGGKVGMLFIDFETPHRLRVHGTATVGDTDPLLEHWPGAEWIVRVSVMEIFVNCARYVHRYQRLHASPYVPQPARPAPFPQWKRIDAVRDALPARDLARAQAIGGSITEEEYRAMLARGQS
ncbi:MAG: pyridoxamine 5'-phosphate oxidase [Proteobacteria bacterium]|nr:MAG: pyridoxamine 5'-phosphate oxidase [Pseudomonadota bacterium]